MALTIGTRRRAVAREHVSGSDDDSGADEPAGYYVAGHDWPAIENNLDIGEIYDALRNIDDAQVEATTASLLTAQPPTPPADENNGAS
jgi:hypothetical protein